MPLVSFQGLQFKITDMTARVEAARKLISTARLEAGEAVVRVTDDPVQMHGGHRYMDEQDVQRFYRDAKIVEMWDPNRFTSQSPQPIVPSTDGRTPVTLYRRVPQSVTREAKTREILY